MPFIDDDLLWNPDNDGKLMDLSCLDTNSSSSNVGIVSSSNGVNCNSSSPSGNNLSGGSNNNGESHQQAELNSYNLGTSTNLPLNDRNGTNGSEMQQFRNQNSVSSPSSGSTRLFGSTNSAISTSMSSLSNSNSVQNSLIGNSTYTLSTLGHVNGSNHVQTHNASGNRNGNVQSLNSNNNGNISSSHLNNSGCSNNGNGSNNGFQQAPGNEIIGLHPLSQLSQADLNGLVSTLDDDDEDLFKQLGETSFELDDILDNIVEGGMNGGGNNGSSGNNNSSHMSQNPSSYDGTNGHNHAPNPYMNFSNGSMGNQLQTLNNITLDEQSRNGTVRRRRKGLNSGSPNKNGLHSADDVSLEDVNGTSISNPAGSNQNLQRKGSLNSILQNQLIQPHMPSMDGGMRGKHNIAAANPLLAEKLAAPMTPGQNMGESMQQPQHHRNAGESLAQRRGNGIHSDLTSLSISSSDSSIKGQYGSLISYR